MRSLLETVDNVDIKDKLGKKQQNFVCALPCVVGIEYMTPADIVDNQLREGGGGKNFSLGGTTTALGREVSPTLWYVPKKQ